MGGGAAAADILDTQDALVESRLQAETADGADLRAIDMYREHKYATVQRVSLGLKTFKGGRSRAEVPRGKASRPQHWGGNSGAVFAR